MDTKIIILIIAVLLVVLGGVIFWPRKAYDSTDNKVDDLNKGNNNKPEASSADFPDGTYQVLTGSSTVEWEGRKILISGYKDVGTINIKEGSITVAEGEVKMAKVVFNMNSIKVESTGVGQGQSKLESHLKSADFFDVEKYPVAGLTIREVVESGDNHSSHMAKGDLTIKGVTNPIEFPVKISLMDDMVKIEGQTDVDRTKWNIRYGSTKFFDNLANNVIDDNFTVSFDLTVKK